MKMSGVEEEWGGDKRFERNRTKMVFYSVARQSVVSQEGKINKYSVLFFSVFRRQIKIRIKINYYYLLTG